MNFKDINRLNEIKNNNKYSTLYGLLKSNENKFIAKYKKLSYFEKKELLEYIFYFKNNLFEYFFKVRNKIKD